MPIHYIDPDWTGNNSGTFSEPYDTISQLTLSSNDSVYFKRGTHFIGSASANTDRIDCQGLDNITIGAYYDNGGVPAFDNDTELPLPIISNYSEITSGFVESPADHWRYDTGNTNYFPILLGLGSLKAWSPRRNYAVDAFTTLGQWNTGGSGGAGDAADIWVYSTNAPTSDFGTIYWSRQSNGFFARFREGCSNILVENIEVRYSANGIIISSGDDDVADTFTIRNCKFEHCYRGIVSNIDNGTLDNGVIKNLTIVNNVINDSGSVGINFSGPSTGIVEGYENTLVANNVVTNTGGAESIGGIYGKMHGRYSPTDFIVENNYVDTVFDVRDYWPSEQRGIYVESTTENTVVRRNYVRNCAEAAYHCNTSTGPIYFYGNTAENCGKCFGSSDSSNNDGSGVMYIYNNTGINVVQGLNINRPDTTGDTSSIELKNNIFVGDGTGNGIAFDANSDDLSLLNTDYNFVYNFNNDMTRAGSPSGLQHSLGDNDVVDTDPKLNPDYTLQASSPCIGAGISTLSEMDHDGKYRKTLSNDIGAKWFDAHEDSTVEELLASGGST